MTIGRPNGRRCGLCRFRRTDFPPDDHDSPHRPRLKGLYGPLATGGLMKRGLSRHPFRARNGVRYLCRACRPRYDAVRAAELPAMAGYLEWLRDAPRISGLPGELVAEWNKDRMKPGEPFAELVDEDWVAESLARMHAEGLHLLPGPSRSASLSLVPREDGGRNTSIPGGHRDVLSMVTEPKGLDRGLFHWQGSPYLWRDIEEIAWTGSVHRWRDGKIVLDWRAEGVWNTPDYP